jgi:peptide/nickel transport system permease protein
MSLAVLRPIISRLAQVVVVGIVVMIITFMLVHIVPGDPAVTILGPRATPQTLAHLRHEMHLDKPLAQQFSTFVTNVLRGNLGNSLLPGATPVTQIVIPALKVTMTLIAASVLISLVVGVPLGVLSGITRKSGLDLGIRGTMMVLLAMPPFLVGFLLLLFALDTAAFPAGGWGNGISGSLDYLPLPALALSAYLTPIIARTVRQSIHEVLSENFIEAAVARGLPAWRLVARHILPNGLLPLITLVGYNIGALIGGAVVIEAVFNLPGIGSALVYAVSARDYPVVEGAALVTAILVVIINAVADVLYQYVDPRTRPTQ